MSASIQNLKRPKKTQSLPAPRPIGAWQLWKASITELWRGWKGYTLILAVIAVPSDLLALSPTLGKDAGFNSFFEVAAVIMNIALAWAVVQRERTGKIPRPAAAYYEGSVLIVRYLSATFLLVLTLIPAAVSAVLFVFGVLAVADGGGSLVEQLLIIGVSLVIAAPSFWMLVRFGLGPTVTVTTDLRPLAALRYSRLLTVGRFWRMLGRYICLILGIVIAAIPISLITALLSLLHLGLVSVLFFQLVTTFVAFPLINIYLIRLFRYLEAHPRPLPAPVIAND